ncbi:MAG: MTH1187 family thiamine-binding protein [Candidatus Caenarcaniphilales bacterium]|jgi:uncharacterized protein (TIGR00106 family)|nr:MTH1187 family thiamine-binding protein [Candidatus Caenarcaniphilales bacterium]
MISLFNNLFGTTRQSKEQDPFNSLNVVADLAINPHISGSSANALKTCKNILEQRGLNPQLHACGTNIEGTFGEVVDAVRACHKALHKQGINKVSTDLHLSTRVDKEQSLESRTSI